MEQKFTFKDLALFVLLTVLIVSVWLAMAQYDRQWRDIQQMQTGISELTTEQSRTSNEIAELRERIEAGVVVSGTGDGANGANGGDGEKTYDPFARIKDARAEEGFAEGDWLIDAFGSKVSVITALTYKDLYGRTIQEHVLEALLTIDPVTLEERPWLAKSWQIKDNTEAWQAYMDEAKARYAKAADDDPKVYAERVEKRMREAQDTGKVIEVGSEEYKTLVAGERSAWIDEQIDKDPARPPAIEITFQLRKNARFSDGTPLTSEDVVFSYDLLMNPELDAASTRQFYDNIEDAVASGPYEVTFKMREPHYMALSMAGGRPVIPKHFYSRFTVEQINDHPGLLMGSGPYRLPDPQKGWRPGELLELVRNERYWGPQTGFDKLIWHEVTNDVARLTMYINGEIDLFAANPEQYNQLKDNEEVVKRSQTYEYKTVPSGYMWLAWQQVRNDKPTMFADKRVRQAMTYLTERQRICDEVFHGFAWPTTGPWAEDSPQADPTLQPRAYDPAKGKALLAEVGWKDRDGDGVLENAKGEPFRFSLTYPAGSADYDRLALFLKDSYSRAGIVMDPEPLEFSVMISRLEQQAFDAIILRWGGGAVESDIRQMFHSSQANKGGDNVMNYRSPELDALIDQARTTLDRDARMKLWQACHRILYEDQPYTFMLRQKSLRFIDDRIRNIERVTTGLNDREEWFAPLSQQKWGK